MCHEWSAICRTWHVAAETTRRTSAACRATREPNARPCNWTRLPGDAKKPPSISLGHRREPAVGPSRWSLVPERRRAPREEDPRSPGHPPKATDEVREELQERARRTTRPVP